MSQAFPIISLLKNPRYILVASMVFGSFFYLNYYLMANMIGEQDFMCVMGGGLTPFNITFALIISAIASLVVVGFLENQKNRSSKSSLKMGSASAVGLTLGTLTSFCTLCSLPVLTLFGLSIPITFLTDYELYFKFASFFLLIGGLYLVNRELKKGCTRCVE